MSESQGQVAVVVGGASGIGAAIAARFTADGWRVVVADLPATDVTDEESVATMLDGILADRFAQLLPGQMMLGLFGASLFGFVFRCPLGPHAQLRVRVL